MLNAWPGVKYGIPFPVLCRSSFGYYGTYFCTLTRGVVAIMWLSFQMWSGANGLYTGIGRAAGPGWSSWVPINDALNLTQLLLFLAYAALHCVLIYAGIGKLRLLVYATTPLQVGCKPLV